MSGRSGGTPRLGWLAGAGTVLAVLACYGTLAVVGALSLLGVTLVIDPGAWAGAIVVFAVLAVLGVALGYARHRVAGPLVLAAIGAALVIWAMLGSYSRLIEVAGFAGLIAAAIWDWRLKKGASLEGAVPKAP